MPYVLFRPRYEYSHLAALAFPQEGRKDEKKRKEERKEGGGKYRGLELYEDAYFIYIILSSFFVFNLQNQFGSWKLFCFLLICLIDYIFVWNCDSKIVFYL